MINTYFFRPLDILYKSKFFINSYLYLFLFCITTISVSAQKSVEDSLKNAYDAGKISAFTYYDELYFLKSEGEPDVAKRFAFKSLDVAKSKSEKLYAYANLGEFYLNNQKYDSAQYYFGDITQSSSSPVNLLARVYNNIGVLHLEKGDYDVALDNFFKALKYREEEQNEEGLIKVLNNIASIYYMRGENEKGISYSIQALQLAKKYKIHDRMAVIAYNLGLVNNMIGNEPKAIEYIKESKDVFLEKNQINRVAQCNVSLSEVYLKLDSLDKATEVLEESLFDKDINIRNQASLLFMKGQIEYRKKNFKASIDAIERTLAIDKELDNKREIAEDLNLLALGNKALGKYAVAEDYLWESNAIIRAQSDTINLIQNLSFIVENSLAKNAGSKVQKVFEEYKMVKDQYHDVERQKLFHELEMKFETAEKEAKIAEEKLKTQREKTYKYGALGGIGILLLMGGGGFVYNQQLQKQKDIEREGQLQSLQQNMTQLNLSNLNNQINSHDYKNTLTAALNEVQEKAPESYQHIRDLLKITESALYNNDYTENLGTQLEQIEGLVSLAEKQLFEPVNLVVKNEIDPSVQIPKLLLKNLVENSLKHGIKGTGKKATILVETKKQNGTLEINVIDDGRGFNIEDVKSGKGITVYKDLFSFFNEQNDGNASLELKSKNGQTIAMVRIPENYSFG